MVIGDALKIGLYMLHGVPREQKKATSIICRLVSLCLDRFGMITMVENNEKTTGYISCQSLYFLYVYRYIWR